MFEECVGRETRALVTTLKGVSLGEVRARRPGTK